jgi:hypothetical protein
LALCCFGISYPLDSRNTIPSLQYLLVLYKEKIDFVSNYE